MVLSRRNRIAGGTYFFTVTLKDRTSALLVEQIDHLREAFRETKRAHPFHIEAMVVLPEHLHAIWTLPSGDDDYSGRWRAIKARFTRSLVESGVGILRNAKGEYNLWQRRFWEHTLRDEVDLRRHVEYIHFNPVKHGWAKRVRDWPHSTFPATYEPVSIRSIGRAMAWRKMLWVTVNRLPDSAVLHPGYIY